MAEYDESEAVARWLKGLSKDEGNLRCARVTFPHPHTGHPCKGVVVTRTRGRRWLIQAGRLPASYGRGFRRLGPRCIVLDRAAFTIERRDDE